MDQPTHAACLLYRVPDPERFGVAEVGKDQFGEKILSIEEKPKIPKSDLAIAGAYYFPADVWEMIQSLKPSGRGELEVTDLLKMYLKQGRLNHSFVNGAWSDMGTFDSLTEVALMIYTEKKRMEGNG